MSDIEQERRPLPTKGRGTVRQNFPHGRSNAVVVETRKRRITKPGDEQPKKPVFVPKTTSPAKESRKVEKDSPADGSVSSVSSVSLDSSTSSASSASLEHGKSGSLSSGEMDARARALEEARQREESESRERANDIDDSTKSPSAKPKVESEVRDTTPKTSESTSQKTSEETSQKTSKKASQKNEKTSQKTSQKDEAEERARLEEEARIAAADASAAAAATEDSDVGRKVSSRSERGRSSSERDDERSSKKNESKARQRGDESRRRTKLTLSNALNEDVARSRSLASVRRQREKQKRSQDSALPHTKVRREVTVPDTITIQELAGRMSERAVDVVKLLMEQGQVMKPADIIDADMAQLIAEEMGHTVTRVSESDVEEGLHDASDDFSNLVPRPPVVSIMGHVDHGKTSLLDKLRSSRVVEGEAGGITQHIAAYRVERNNNTVTFLDMPGHSAFSAMRSRGASATDIAVIVIAADDSVMPQTTESINHAKAAKVPIIVAINKMDVEGADANKVRNDLLQHEIVVESLGGDVLAVEVSAKTGDGIENLLDAIILQSELLELKSNPNRAGEGIVIEAQLDRGRGAVATVIVQRGTLRRGDIVVAGSEWGKVRALVDDYGKQLKEAGPSVPCEVLGLSGAPQAGDRLIVVDSEARAREVSEYRHRKSRELEVAAQAGKRGSLEQMMTNLNTKQTDEALFVVKADTQGSVEAISSAINDMSNDELNAKVVHGGVGGITEADVTLAMASGTPIIGFNVRANKQASELAKREGIDIRYYSVIYNLVDDAKGILSGMLSPERKETFVGYAEIREVFVVSKIGKVAGCLITEGHVRRGFGVRLLRDDVVIHEGELSTLKRFKDEVEQVESGMECGIGFKDYQDIRQGDIIECFSVELVERKIG